MGLSELLGAGVMQVSGGGIVNRFHIRSRRSTFFFEDILAEYVGECEGLGYGGESYDLACEWMSIATDKLLPSVVRRMPLDILFSNVLRYVWRNIGVLDDIRCTLSSGTATIATKGEMITRVIGENRASEGIYAGVVSAISGRRTVCESSRQNPLSSVYDLRITDEPAVIPPSRERAEYDRLNSIRDIQGITLKKAIVGGMFQLNGNQLYMRGRRITPIEATVFHLIGSRLLIKGRLIDISRRYFEEMVEKDPPDGEKITLLKNTLQAMGWGGVNVVTGDGELTVSVQAPPYGLKKGCDNWGFLDCTVEGYLRMLGDYKLAETAHMSRSIMSKYVLK